MNITRTLMIVVLIGSCMLVPDTWTHFPAYFDTTTREGNAGHFDFHPASLMMSGVLLLLPIILLLSVIGKRACTKFAMALVLYLPIYVIYGNYVVEPRGLHTQPMNLIILFLAIAAIEFLLVKHVKYTRSPQHAPPAGRGEAPRP